MKTAIKFLSVLVSISTYSSSFCQQSTVNNGLLSFVNKSNVSRLNKHNTTNKNSISPLLQSVSEKYFTATTDLDGWSLNGNEVSDASKNAATALSFIGTPASIPIKFKMGFTWLGYLNSNVFFGYLAGGTYASSEGNNNIALGYEAMNGNTSSTSNIGIGAWAAKSPSIINNNIFIGRNDNSNPTGNYNIALGGGTFKLISGNKNIGLGSGSGRSVVGDNSIFLGSNSLSTISPVEVSNKLYISNSSTTMPLIYGDFSAGFVSIGDVPVEKRNAVATSGDYGLMVKKGILTERVKMELASASQWADYVFDDGYKDNMPSLSELEKFINQNKHLPGVSSASQMVENGLEVSETYKMFLEKMEELTLYMIDMDKQLSVMKKELSSN